MMEEDVQKYRKSVLDNLIVSMQRFRTMTVEELPSVIVEFAKTELMPVMLGDVYLPIFIKVADSGVIVGSDFYNIMVLVTTGEPIIRMVHDHFYPERPIPEPDIQWFME